MNSTLVSFHDCPNGCVHINVGNITLNFAKKDFIEFARQIDSYASQFKETKPGLVLEYTRRN